MHKRRIERGARFLDREFPGWYERVNPHTLDPDSDINCALGQALNGSSGEYVMRRFFVPEDAESRLWLCYPGVWALVAWGVRHGFLVGREHDSQWLDAWTQEIRKRQPTTFPAAWAEKEAAVA